MQVVNFVQILHTLSQHQVDFIVVGGVSATLQGASVTTFDIDIVHSREPDNLLRLLEAFETWMPSTVNSPRNDSSHSYRTWPAGHQLLLTRYGPLDVLGVIELGHDYQSLLPLTITIRLDAETNVKVLKLETLIQLKETNRRAKDLAMLPILKRTLEELQGDE